MHIIIQKCNLQKYTKSSYNNKKGQNDHSNPYIESTTVLSDNKILQKKTASSVGKGDT